MTIPTDSPLRDEVQYMLRQARAPRLRTMRRFAEEELVVHTGPCKGRFRVANQPFMGLWLDAVDSGRWRRFNTTGPRQAGKTLLTCIIPVLYHLFEIRETVIFAVPDLDIADDKFRENLLPAIGVTRYAELLPTSGEGSRSGRVRNAVVFKNGATIKFMTGGASGLASDRGRQGYTARVIVVTEKSAFGVSGETSVEANKLEQIRACANAFGNLARFYEESTLTTLLDPTYVDLKQGTDSKIVSDCPHCNHWIAPERENLHGWQEAMTVLDAEREGHFQCPACGHRLSEDDRRAMNKRASLLHRGQTIAAAEELENGNVAPLIVGDLPATDTLGFRFSAFHNMFRRAADVAMDEWRAARANDEDDAQRKMCQFVWALPYASQVTDVAALSSHGLTSRQAKTPKGLVPADCILLTVGVDIGKWKSWWKAIAWGPTQHIVVDYDSINVESEQLGLQAALMKMLRQVRERCETGWTWEQHQGSRPADLVGIDAGFQDSVIYEFIRECQLEPATVNRYWASKGFGEGQITGRSYHQPKRGGNNVCFIGQDYHVVGLAAHRVNLIEFDADAWKTWLHERYACEATQPGAILLYNALPKTHQQIARHLTAEKQQIEFVPDRGERIKWICVRRDNHHLDTGVIASLLAHFGGIRIVGEPPRAPDPERRPQHHHTEETSRAFSSPDGRPFLITER